MRREGREGGIAHARLLLYCGGIPLVPKSSTIEGREGGRELGAPVQAGGRARFILWNAWMDAVHGEEE